MKDYDYYRDSWPRIVRDCFAHNGRMFAVTVRFDDAGRVAAYEQGRELSEQQALEFRGMTIAVYGDSAPKKR